jgi:phosphonate transport system substrate-binding protein
MTNLYRYFFKLCSSLLLAFVAVSYAGATKAKILTLGTISADPLEEIRTFNPFANYLASLLASEGVTKVKVVIAPGIRQAVEMIQREEIDLFIDSSLTALIINKLSGSKFLLRRWKKGRDKYRSVIFATAESGIRDRNGLIGKIIAFEEPFSTSGYILPALAILRSNAQMSPIDNIRSRPKSGEISYVMANDNETQIAWLERDRVAAAAMAEKDFIEFSENALKPLNAIHKTSFVPYHVIIHRSGLKPKLIKHIKKMLLSAHDSDNGRTILQNFERTTKFDEIPDDLLSDIRQYEPHLKNLDID